MVDPVESLVRTAIPWCWVGARLAAGPPPGTVRAPLDAYGSTSDNTEGRFSVRPNSGRYWRVCGDTCNTGYLRIVRFELVTRRRGRRASRQRGLPPGHEDSVLRMENGLLGLPRRPGVHLRQWVAPSSTRFSPITPLRQFHLHFFGNGGIQLPRTASEGRELPPYPGHYPGPWLGPLSFVVRHTPVHPPCTVGRVGTSITEMTPWPSNERHVPVPMVPHTSETDPAQKTGGVFDHRGRPQWKVPPPASTMAPPCQQRYGVTIDGPTQFAFADPLDLLTSGTTHCSSQNQFVTGFPPCGRPCVRHSGEKRFGDVAVSDSSSISFVSYSPLQVG